MATCPTCRTRYPNEVSTCAADGATLLPDAVFAATDPRPGPPSRHVPPLDAGDADIPAGQRVGEYQIEGKLGEGGFGVVYRAVHPLIGKAAAIKVLNRQYSSNPQMVSRFVAEARAVNQIRHRNIIDIFSFGTLEDGRHYYVMELLEGATFDRYLKDRGPLPPDEAIPILRGIARALDAAHGHGIAHRDLKPENVFLVFDEDGGTMPKLLDFGIAKLLGDSMAGHKTRTGTPMGTPNYMSPEQCRGKNVDQRTDIYSFGIVVHETMTGRLPFDGDDVMEVLFKQTTAAAPPMSSVLPGLAPALDAPVLRMLEKDPAARPASVVDGLEALAAAAQEAGYDVQVAGRRGEGVRSDGGPRRGNEGPHSGGSRTPGPVGAGTSRAPGGTPPYAPGGMTPHQLGALSDARTMAQGATSASLAVSAPEVKATGARKALYAVAAAGLVAAGVAVAFSRASAGGARGAPGPSDVPSATALPAASASGPGSAAGSAPEPAVRPAQSAASPPPASASAPLASATVGVGGPAEIELTVQSTPAAVDVYADGEKVGTSPGPLHLKARGDAPVKLTFKAPGYRDASSALVPSPHATVAVTLQRAPPRQVGKPEVEY